MRCRSGRAWHPSCFLRVARAGGPKGRPTRRASMARATAAVLALGLVAASPAASWASGLEARIGGFFPRAQSDLFSDDAELYLKEGRPNAICAGVPCPGLRR